MNENERKEEKGETERDAQQMKAKPKRAAKPGKPWSKAKERPSKIQVEFAYFSPEATAVYLVGDFNDWDSGSMPMKRHKDGTWKVKVRLAPGRYEYKILADGEWVHYIRGVERAPNPFGTENFVMWVD